MFGLALAVWLLLALALLLSKRDLHENDLSELPAGIFDELVELDYLCVGMSKKGRAGTDGMAVDGRLAWPAGVAMWWGFGVW